MKSVLPHDCYRYGKNSWLATTPVFYARLITVRPVSIPEKIPDRPNVFNKSGIKAIVDADIADFKKLDNSSLFKA